MKTKSAKTVDSGKVGVAKASKLIKKAKPEKPAAKPEKPLPAAKPEKPSPAANPAPVESQPKKVHKKKDAKRLAKLNKDAGGKPGGGGPNGLSNGKGAVPFMLRKPLEATNGKNSAQTVKQPSGKPKNLAGGARNGLSKATGKKAGGAEPLKVKKPLPAANGKKAPIKTISGAANGVQQPSGKPKNPPAKQPAVKKVKAIADDEEVETSESESEVEQDASNTEENAGNTEENAGTTEPEKPEKIIRDKEHSVFVGNLPPTVKPSTMRALFAEYGKILSIRFRSNEGQKLLYRNQVKKVKSLNCYIRFAEKQDVEKACVLNGHMVEEHRIRVSPHDVKPLGAVKSTVFVGNIHRGTTDNELYDFFSPVGEIEYVRQIANRCVAYVCFKKGVSIRKALKLDQHKLNNRPLRIEKVDPAKSNVKKNKKGHLVPKNKIPSKPAAKKEAPVAGEKKDASFHGNVVNEGAKKKRKRLSTTKKVLSQKLKAAMVTTKKH